MAMFRKKSRWQVFYEKIDTALTKWGENFAVWRGLRYDVRCGRKDVEKWRKAITVHCERSDDEHPKACFVHYNRFAFPWYTKARPAEDIEFTSVCQKTCADEGCSMFKDREKYEKAVADLKRLKTLRRSYFRLLLGLKRLDDLEKYLAKVREVREKGRIVEALRNKKLDQYELVAAVLEDPRDVSRSGLVIMTTTDNAAKPEQQKPRRHCVIIDPCKSEPDKCGKYSLTEPCDDTDCPWRSANNTYVDVKQQLGKAIEEYEGALEESRLLRHKLFESKRKTGREKC